MDDPAAFIAAQEEADMRRVGHVHDLSCNAVLDPFFDPEARPCECGEPERIMREIDARRAILACCTDPAVIAALASVYR